MIRLWLGMVLLAGCWRQTPADDTPGVGTPTDSVLPALEVGPGDFAFRTRSLKPEYLVSAVGPVTAVRCEVLGSVQLFLYETDFAIGLLIGLDTPLVSGEYAIVREREDVPTPGTARLALQIYPEERSFSMPGVSGSVVIDSLASALYGSFDTRVFENVFLDSVRVDGVFNGVEVIEGDPEECRVMGDPPDSTVSGLHSAIPG